MVFSAKARKFIVSDFTLKALIEGFRPGYVESLHEKCPHVNFSKKKCRLALKLLILGNLSPRNLIMSTQLRER